MCWPHRHQLQVRLTPEQHEQRKAAYADIKQLQLQLDDLPDGEGEQREALQTELNAKQAALDNLVAHFQVRLGYDAFFVCSAAMQCTHQHYYHAISQKLNTEAALKGELQRPSERRASLTAPDVPTNGSAPRTNYHPTRPHKNQGDLGGPRHSGGHRGLHDGDSGVYGLQGVQPGRGDYGRGEYERGDYGRGDYGGGRGDYGGGEYNGQYGSRGNYGRGGRRGGHYDPSRQYSGERLYQDDDWGSLKGHNYAGNYAATDCTCSVVIHMYTVAWLHMHADWHVCQCAVVITCCC